jgi:imidazolonepropionase
LFERRKRKLSPFSGRLVIDADLLVLNADALVTCAGPAPRRGPAQGDAGLLANGALAARDGRIVFAGATGACLASVRPRPDCQTIDARGCTVLPGFVDAHTHLVYAGDRRHELRRRLAGATYAEIAAGGGGIVSTVAATRAAGVDDLVASALPRLDEILRNGTTTCEVKSGYGLDTAAEIRMLEAVGRLAARQPVDLVPTFMGAHEVPLEYRHHRAAYVDLVVREMIPQVAAAGLAAWCDVFCETGVFTPEESERVLRAGQAAGLRARIHADELGASGGSLVAARVGARSADHLIHVPPEGIRALGAAGVIATLLPAAAFYLKLGRFAPARDLVAAGVPVALASDVNPGGGFSPSMPFAITLGCFGMGLTLEEALVGATINGAAALDLQHEVGSLEPGKLADAVVVGGDLADLLRVGAGAIRCVVKRGRVVHPLQPPAVPHPATEPRPC